MKYPFLTIVIPSFNQGQFIEKCLSSIVDQNFNNLEVIICDNCSSDNTINIINEFRIKYKYIKLFIKKDKGQSDAINFGIKKAKGKFVTWQNCDDFYYPESFNNFYSTYLRYKNASFIYGDLNLTKKNSRITKNLKFIFVNFFSILSEGMVLSNQSAIWRRSIHKKIGYLVGYYNSFDLEFFLRASFYKYKFFKVSKNKPIAAFRIYKGTKSFTYTKNDEKIRSVIIKNYKKKSAYRFVPSSILKLISKFLRCLCFIYIGEYNYVYKFIKKNIF